MVSMIQRAVGWKVAGMTAACAMLFWAGCQEPPSRLNAPPQGSSQRPYTLQDQYTYMNDNALLAEMSMSASHFMPHRPDLNGLGLRRLTRYAELLRQYPGDIAYDGSEADELANERQERIRAFLAEAGVDPNTCKVVRGMAGGDGMRAKEAVAARDFSTFTPEQAQLQNKGRDWKNQFGDESR